MINIIDSGAGAYNTMAYLSDLTQKDLTDRVVVKTIGTQIGSSSTQYIRDLFSNFRDANNINHKNSVLACNTLNSLMGYYEGAFNELIKYLDSNNSERSLVLCTDNTKTILETKYKHKFNIDIMSLDQSVSKKIDIGELVKIELNSNLHKNLILGCTHYDLLQIQTNMDIISTSKLCAMRIKQLLNI
ncbi:MAG: hypothetical protein K8E24_015200 [Methanobacterium paludis]|nr:hypothetical protein [Methanobacterium paludis]